MSRHICTDCQERIPFGMAVLRSVKLAGIAAWCRDCYSKSYSANFSQIGD